MKERNLVDLFLKQASRYPSRAALRFKRAGVYHDISWLEFRDYVVRVGLALQRMGIRKGDRVALLSENRPEWVYTDLGSLSVGAVVVPIHATSSVKEIHHILSHCAASTIFVSTAEQLARIDELRKDLPALTYVIAFDAAQDRDPDCLRFQPFIASIQAQDQSDMAHFQLLVGQVSLDDLATIIYTSGTTGPSKGVMLTHRNLLANCYDAKEALPIGENDIALSFLPLSHVFERMAGYYLAILCGATIAYAENMKMVPQNLLEVKPSLSCAVPRFFEKMRAEIQAHAEHVPTWRRRILEWAREVGQRTSPYRLQRKRLPPWLAVQQIVAKKLVYSKVYTQMGGRLRFFVSGGAPLAREIAEFFYTIGILILEGYGLTETSPVISVNRLESFKFGSVGRPLRQVETRIASDGEILVRGPSVMKGYYQDAEATREAVRDSWFHTGDLGKIDSEGYLYIIGRKKDIIVTSAGKNIAPQNIENAILADPAISQIVILGDGHNFLTALVVPDFEQVKAILGLPADIIPAALVQRADVHSLIAQRIEYRTRDCASHESIKYFTLLAREFSQDREEITLTLKIKRKVVAEHYKVAIEKMYEGAEERLHEGGNQFFYVL